MNYFAAILSAIVFGNFAVASQPSETNFDVCGLTQFACPDSGGKPSLLCCEQFLRDKGVAALRAANLSGLLAPSTRSADHKFGSCTLIPANPHPWGQSNLVGPAGVIIASQAISFDMVCAGAPRATMNWSYPVVVPANYFDQLEANNWNEDVAVYQKTINAFTDELIAKITAGACDLKD